jgi:hypothetical protein
MNPWSSYSILAKIVPLTLMVHPPFYCTKHSHVIHITRYLPAMNRCEHTQPTQPKNTIYRHHDPPHPPASSSFNLTGEHNRCKLRNRYQSPQHGNAIFVRETNYSFIFLMISLQEADQPALGLELS